MSHPPTVAETTADAAIVAVTPTTLPLWTPADLARPIAWRDGLAVTLAEFARDVALIAQPLPRHAAMINLCEDRYHFLAAYAAALSRGHTVLLPSSRAEEIVREVAAANVGSYRFDDGDALVALSDVALTTASSHAIQAERAVMIGFTSGSTGQPKQFPKLWRSVHGSNACNAAAIRQALQLSDSDVAWIVATVPPQHMYGMELSVLLPLLGGMGIHAGRPLFPADIAQTLEEVPAPRVLVSTPLHLRTMLESEQVFPRADLIISATAPLDAALAQRVEQRLGGQLLEMFGATETCIFASRRTSISTAWQLYPGVTLQPRAEGTLVNAPWFAEPVLLQDIVELHDGNRFTVVGRNADLIEVAGKRASLAELTRRLLAVEGVRDAVVLQPGDERIAAIRRVAALVVAPGLSSREVLARLASSIDPAFMPRPLHIVDRLPRNDVGKLSRELLLQLLRQKSASE